MQTNQQHQKHNRWRTMLYALLVFTLLISAGCGGGATPQPTQEAEQSFSIAPQEALPPALVEVQPLPGSILPAATPVTFYFNQPMNHNSVESSLSVQPSLTGSLTWADDSTLVFTPQGNLPASETVSFTFSVTARSSRELALTEPVQVSFQSPDYLRPISLLPAADTQDVDPTSAVIASFNQPVVALSTEASNQMAAFTINPEISGRGEWINTSTYIYYPDPAMEGGVQYSVTLNPRLESLTGVGLAEDESAQWSFQTAIPALDSVDPSDGSQIGLNPEFTLTFNQPMDRASMAASLSFRNARGDAIPGSLAWSNADTTVVFQPDTLLERNATYFLEVNENAQGLGGTTLGANSQLTYTTVPRFAVQSITPASGEVMDLWQGSGSFSISFTAPFGVQDAEDLITLSPEVDGLQPYFSSGSTDVYIYGYFLPETTYTVTLSPQIVDQWGQRLGNVPSLQFRTGSSDPQLEIPMLNLGSEALFLLPDETHLAAGGINLNSLTISSGQIQPADFFINFDYLSALSSPIPQELTTWQQTLSLTPNRIQDFDIPLTQQGESLSPGLYYFQIDSLELVQDPYYTPIAFMAVVSNIHITFKTSPGEALVWAIDLRTGQPAANIPVSLYSDWGSVLASGVTDDQGLATFSFTPLPVNQSHTLFVMLSQPGSEDFSLAATGWNNGINAWDFNLPYTEYGSDTLAYLYTDRPIYQPGQEVDFRGTLWRNDNGRYTSANTSQVTVQVYGAPDITYTNPILQTYTLQVSQYGTFNGTFTLPESAPLGNYYLLLEGEDSATCYFQVAEYRKPDIDLSVSFTEDAFLSGQDLNAHIDASYYFGAPAGRLHLSWTLYASPGYFYLPQYQTGGVNLGWLERSYLYDQYSSLGRFLFADEAQTDSSGAVDLTIPADELAAALQGQEGLQNLVLEVTIQDESGYTVSSRASTLLHPSEIYIGVRPDSWNGVADQESGFDILTTDWDSHSSGNHALQAEFLRVQWEQNGYDPETGAPNYDRTETSVGTTNFTTGADGRARVSFTPATPGTYILRVSGEGALTELLVWVGGEGSALWPVMAEQHVELTADADSYQPGDTASIFIPNDFMGSTQALITIERGRVMDSQVVEIMGPSYTLDLPLTDEDAPNIYISVTLIGKDSSGKWSFRQGYLQLNVEPIAEVLNVDLVGEPTRAEPGGEVTLTIQVTDSTGAPVQGEFSLALVDAALLALADPNSTPIVDAFYGTQPLEVATSLSLAVYGRRLETPQFAAEVGGRGGGGGDGAETSVRTDFRDTAYWNGSIESDANGMAELTVTLPDNLTTWVADLRGLTRGAQVGQATLEITTSLPLMIRPVTPQFMVVGDHSRLSALINNQTEEPLEVQVSLQGSGFELDDSAEANQMVSVAAGEQESVAWWGTVQNVDFVSLTFTALSGELRDSATPSQGEIPVLAYSTPQSFGTSGMLSEAGQQLEVISLPRSFTPTDGTLSVELSPSLAANILDGLEALEAYPFDYAEPLLSRMLANLEFYNALQRLGIGDSTTLEQLRTKVEESLNHLLQLQNYDGGWSWSPGGTNSPYLSAYILFGLSEAQAAGFDLNETIISNTQQYLLTNGVTNVSMESMDWQLDQTAFIGFALSHSGQTDINVSTLYTLRSRLSPWARALLALTIHDAGLDENMSQTLVSDLESGGVASSTGISWQPGSDNWHTYSTANFTTAVVIYALAHLDPANALLPNAVRFLSAHRQASGCWYSTYESTWALMALTAYMQGTGELQAAYDYSATMNGQSWLSGSAGGLESMSGISGSLSISQLLSDSPNALVLQRDGTTGRLYYRAFLEVERPVETAGAVDRGISLTRSYYRSGQDCREVECQPVESIAAGNPSPVLLVRINIVVPEDRYYVTVEDFFPSGTEVLNPRLNTSQQGSEGTYDYLPSDPYASGWGWWYFDNPQLQSDRISWTAEYLPAGSYQLIYRLVVLQPGEYRVLPAHAWEIYFPEVEGATGGMIFTIR